MRKRQQRQEAIRRVVRAERVKTQRALVDLLRAEGFDCTQATVSRDITEMGLRKLPEGMYVLAEDLHLQRMVNDLVRGRAPFRQSRAREGAVRHRAGCRSRAWTRLSWKGFSAAFPAMTPSWS